MKVIFLDIDGVMVTGEMLNRLEEIDGFHFNPFARGPVYQLNRIVETTGAEIVISSTWRCDGPRWNALMKHFEQQGVRKKPLVRTPHLTKKRESGLFKTAQRGEEIKTWLSNDVQDYVVLDDDTDMDDVRAHFVYVKNGMWRGGLNQDHADAAIALLNLSKEEPPKLTQRPLPPPIMIVDDSKRPTTSKYQTCPHGIPYSAWQNCPKCNPMGGMD